ncbi:MAG: hypothetical protein SCH70_14665 [Candidatus Methanoperedens sp.]|nr:hypothetical protein [Candidatus Methanoperedens sp.]
MKIKEIFGVLFGVLLFIAWIVILNSMAFILLSEKNIINGTEVTKIRDLGQIFNWIKAGVLPFFLVAGHYLLYSSTADSMEKINDIIAIKSTLLGFSVWLLIVVITFLLKTNISFWISTAGGYFTMVIIFVLIKMFK